MRTVEFISCGTISTCHKRVMKLGQLYNTLCNPLILKPTDYLYILQDCVTTRLWRDEIFNDHIIMQIYCLVNR